MAQLDLLLSDADRFRLLHWTLEHGAALVPDVHYPEPHYEEIRSVAKLQPFLSARTFYVLRSDWQTEKLVMKPHVNKLKGPGFYIAQRYGGPSLCYALYPQREDGGRSILGRGTIDYYPFYYSISNGRQLDPNPSMKSFYTEVTRLMKEGGSRIKGKLRSVWVAPDAGILLASKQASAPAPWGEAAGGVE
jgi:hypothetical protein